MKECINPRFSNKLKRVKGLNYKGPIQKTKTASVTDEEWNSQKQLSGPVVIKGNSYCPYPTLCRLN